MATRTIQNDSSNIKRKRRVIDEPKRGDFSQYTFDTNDPFDSRGYSDSTSLPKNNDKFQDKDLNITAAGSTINEKIIEKNLKFQGASFIRIDKCFAEFVGTPMAVKDVRVKMWMMTDSFVKDNDKLLTSYSSLLSLVQVQELEDRVFEYKAGRLANGVDLGNLSFIEGVDILTDLENLIYYDFGIATSTPTVNEFANSTVEYDPEIMITHRDGEVTHTFDRLNYNPLYMIFELTAHGDPEDKRDSMWQVFQMNNLELWDPNNALIGRQKTFTFDEMYMGEYHGTESDGGIEDPALKITDFQVTINTKINPPNEWTTPDDLDIYKEFFGEILPSTSFIPSDKKSLLNISPYQELNNNDNVNINKGSSTNIFPDFFPKQHIGILNVESDELVPNVYLDEYRDDMSEEIQAIASAPAMVSFNFEIADVSDTTVYGKTFQRYLPKSTGDGTTAEDYYYFVINWDDMNNEIKTIDDWLKNRPTTYRELIELNQNNLYILANHNQKRRGTSPTYDITTDIRLSNTYTTPGIKTIKTIMFSYDEATNQVGRWKLITSRFYLDIPINQYPDFGEIGGQDFTTIPWPHTTPVIGGVSEISKYKTSVQETLSSGNIGSTDIIDETLLINDIDNDELGENILTFDLEQIRYFSKPYGINKLLNLVYNEEFIGEPIYLTTDTHLRTLPGYYGGGIEENDQPMLVEELSWTSTESTAPFGNDGYLLGVFSYQELEQIWNNDTEKQQDILEIMVEVYGDVYNELTWIYTVEDLNGFVYDGNLPFDSTVFTSHFALAHYYYKTGYYPIIGQTELEESDVEQWNGIGRPDIAEYITAVINAELNLNPPTTDEGGNEVMDGDGGGFGGGIDEGGIDGSEPHFQGGFPGGGTGQIDDPGTDTGAGEGEEEGGEFPPALPRLLINEPNQSAFYQTGDEVQVVWEQVEDNVLNEHEPGNYPNPPGYYYMLAQELDNPLVMFPVQWRLVMIYLDKYVGNQYVEDIFVGVAGAPDDPNPIIDFQWDTVSGQNPYTKRIKFNVPTANELGRYQSSNNEQYRVRLVVGDANDQKEVSMQGSALYLDFIFIGGEEPSATARPKNFFRNTIFTFLDNALPNRYNQTNSDGSSYWDGDVNKFPTESSVGQIFISDNQDADLKDSCKLELNTGELTTNSIYDSSGNGAKGLLIGDYKIKKDRKGVSMRRDSFIKVPKKTDNSKGAL